MYPLFAGPNRQRLQFFYENNSAIASVQIGEDL